MEYLSQRSLSHEIAAEYCREIHYEKAGKPYFAIGFKNDRDGWELRNPYFKSCISPKEITTTDRGHDTCMVFEGFMDFLSYLSFHRSTTSQSNAVVLNSVVNLPKAIPFLQRHKIVHAFLDNDESGRKALAEIQGALPECEVIDHSVFYRPHKDVNEYLQATKKPLIPAQKKAGRRQI